MQPNITYICTWMYGDQQEMKYGWEGGGEGGECWHGEVEAPISWRVATTDRQQQRI